MWLFIAELSNNTHTELDIIRIWILEVGTLFKRSELQSAYLWNIQEKMVQLVSFELSYILYYFKTINSWCNTRIINVSIS